LIQAPIDATISLFHTICVILFGLTLWITHIRLLRERNDDGFRETGYERYEEKAIIPMILATFLFLIFFFYCLFSIGNIINGYFNPEYWALNRILSGCK